MPFFCYVRKSYFKIREEKQIGKNTATGVGTELYSQKKGRTFAAYLMLEAADGKAAFRLEFPKKKK